MDIYVARQPILGRDREISGYELLFRSGPENVFRHHDADEASSRLIDNSLHSFGLEQLVAGKKLFVNATRRVIVDELYTVLPPELTVIELLETVDPDDEIVVACENLKRQGYTLALDDYTFDDRWEPLVRLVDVIKVDWRSSTPEQRAQLARRLRNTRVTLLAEKVETYEEFEEARKVGFRLFQGYFFCKPEMIAGRDIPKFKLNYMRLLQEVNRPDIDYVALERVISQELSLSVKLLRYLNSAAFGWRHGVNSIDHAIRVLGERQVKRWASMVALSGVGEDKPAELAVSSLVRARFCEFLGAEAGLRTRDVELFLTGLLSHVDAFFDMPLDKALENLSLAPDIRHAILQNGSPLSPVYRTVQAWERGHWDAIPELASNIQVGENVIADAYRRSIDWTDQTLRSAG